MLEIVKRPLAKEDIKNIWLYSFNAWGETQADSYVLDLDQIICKLAQTPTIGVKLEKVKNNYRQYHTKHHLVFYRYTKTTLEVVRILHEKMDVSRHQM